MAWLVTCSKASTICDALTWELGHEASSTQSTASVDGRADGPEGGPNACPGNQESGEGHCQDETSTASSSRRGSRTEQRQADGRRRYDFGFVHVKAVDDTGHDMRLTMKVLARVCMCECVCMRACACVHACSCERTHECMPARVHACVHAGVHSRLAAFHTTCCGMTELAGTITCVCSWKGQRSTGLKHSHPSLRTQIQYLNPRSPSPATPNACCLDVASSSSSQEHPVR